MRLAKKFFQFFSLLIIALALPIAIFFVKNETNLDSRAGGTPAKLIIDAGNKTPASDMWRNLAQGGEEREGGSMFSSVIGPVRELGINYIRIDHLYDFYNVVGRGPDNALTFDWTRLDRVVDDIRATGATPFFSLSYMPSVLAENNTDAARNWNEWSQVVTSTIEHYSGLRGKSIPNVYYEVWNEPDLFGGFKMNGPKNYLDLYRASAVGAANATNTRPFKFGGPATTALYKNWVEGLLTYARDNKLRLDFISWHRYSERIDIFELDAKAARLYVSAFPEYANIELIVSEAGIDSANNPEYDKSLSAIHTLASIAASGDEISKLFSFEVKDGPGPSQYWGRWGILTHEKYGTPVKKDRFQALFFLKSLGNEKLTTSGSGSWVKAISRVSGRNIQVLVVNFDQTGKHVEAVPITFQNLPFTRFTLRRREFGGRTTDVRTETDSNLFSTVQYFPANSAAIIELVPF